MTVDDCGNISREGPAKRADLDPICMGSHLDTQPTGGKFDGVLGVLAALEVMRTLHAAGLKPTRRSKSSTGPTRKARVLRPRCSLRVSSPGPSRWDFAYTREDRDGKVFLSELERIGYKGTEPVGPAEDRRDVRTPYRAGADPGG